jgi:alanine dehydrogenase
MSAQVGARLLRSDLGGRGVMIGGLPGVAPACVVILGVGSAGFSAAQAYLGLGAQVILIDKDLSRLRYAEQRFDKRVTTVLASPANIRRGVAIADVFIGAITIDDISSHQIVTEEMVKTMKPGAVIIDISINQGGCVATSRPTTIKDPIFTKHGVIHYCVPNMPSLVSRTATYALTNGILMYQEELLDMETKRPETIASLKCGIIAEDGIARHPILTDIYGMPVSQNDCCQ